MLLSEKKEVDESFYSYILKRDLAPFYDSFDRLISFKKVQYQISSKPFVYNSIHTEFKELIQKIEDIRKILKKQNGKQMFIFLLTTNKCL